MAPTLRAGRSEHVGWSSPSPSRSRSLAAWRWSGPLDADNTDARVAVDTAMAQASTLANAPAKSDEDAFIEQVRSGIEQLCNDHGSSLRFTMAFAIDGSDDPARLLHMERSWQEMACPQHLPEWEAALASLGASSTDVGGSAPTTRTVTYSVLGTAQFASLTRTNRSGRTEQFTVSVPWRKTVDTQAGEFVDLAVQNAEESGTIKCMIMSDASVVQFGECSVAPVGPQVAVGAVEDGAGRDGVLRRGPRPEGLGDGVDEERGVGAVGAWSNRRSPRTAWSSIDVVRDVTDRRPGSRAFDAADWTSPSRRADSPASGWDVVAEHRRAPIAGSVGPTGRRRRVVGRDEVYPVRTSSPSCVAALRNPVSNVATRAWPRPGRPRGRSSPACANLSPLEVRPV